LQQTIDLARTAVGHTIRGIPTTALAVSSMKYQLVLRWATPFPIQDVDDIVAIEDQIIDEIGDGGEVEPQKGSSRH
jgi:hypothetical protein